MDPTSIRLVERLYLATITLAALFVAYLGFLAPKRMDESFTWAALPPLHARFVASLYLFGGVYLGACSFARRRAANGPVYGGITVFTGLLLLVTLLNLEAFDFDLAPVWVWTVFYAAPILAIAFCAWRYSTRTRWTSLRAFAPALLALGGATLASSVHHRAVFGATDVSVVVWYSAFGVIAVFGLVSTIAAWRPEPSN